MAKNQEERSREKDRKTPSLEHYYCYYDGATYSPGAYVKVDGVENKLLFCERDGTWSLKDPPG
ncbi:MAG: DUF1496 domain-containing protein [Candidatus Melainabacteria bacterium]|nr:DUF1496 domain-containing protein [Candidatus Melainabacteria bacterium]